VAVPCLADTPNDPTASTALGSGRLKIKLREMSARHEVNVNALKPWIQGR